MQKKKRIAVNARFLLTDKLEGIGWFTWEVARRLVERHPEWEFLFLFDRPYDPAFIPGPNVKPIVVRPPARHPILWGLWFEFSLPFVFQRYRPDVFFSPDGYCSLRASIPTLMVTHDIAHVHFPDQIPMSARWFYDYYVPKYLKRAERIITVSAFSKRDIMAHYPVPASKISITCNGCRAAFKPLSDEEKQAVKNQYAQGCDYFFYIGAVHPRKNVARLIAAFDLFKQRTGANVKLLIGGRFGWLTAAIEKALGAAKYKEDIVQLGYVPDAELPKLTGAALALTYVTLFEGFGVPLLEAMHCDTPIITSNTASLPEVAGHAALLADPNNTHSIASSMELLYSDPALRQKLIEAGRQQRQRFSWEAATETAEGAIIELLNM